MADPPRVVTGGVDTHKDAHVAAALDGVGRVLGTEGFPTTTVGYRALLRWLASFGQVAAIGVEGTGTWGAGLARYLTGEGVRVVEVNRPNRQLRRQRGKSDPTDALKAARVVLSGEATGAPKAATGMVEAVRVLRVTRRSAIKARTQAANQIHAVIDTAPEELRRALIGLPERDRMAKARRLRVADVSTPAGAAKLALRALARRWLSLNDEIAMLDGHLGEITVACAPSLLALNGVGPDCAGAFLAAAGDNPDRLRSERSYAALCGASPLDASSGKQRRHRLNRGGDRAANSALYVVVVCRLRWDLPTQAYMTRRLAEGKTRKEVIRCLKRYVARQIYTAIINDLVTIPAERHAKLQLAA